MTIRVYRDAAILFLLAAIMVAVTAVAINIQQSAKYEATIQQLVDQINANQAEYTKRVNEWEQYAAMLEQMCAQPVLPPLTPGA
jgi:uncharacterized protein involved in exopolysaccharide biosynthesis